MHICFVTTGDIMRLATAKRATGMAGPLAQLGHEVSIIIEDTETNRERLALECPGATPLFFPATPSALSEAALKRALVRAAHPDVVYICAFGARTFVANRYRAGAPRYVAEHSELRSCFREELGPIHVSRERLMEYCSVVLCDGLVCASRYLERRYGERLRRLHLRRPLLYSPYAYNEAVMVPRPGASERLQAQFAGRRVVIYMGAMVENYGLFELLESMTYLRDSAPEILLLLIGRQRDGRVEEYVASHGLGDTVRVLGYVPEDDLPAYFGLAAAFVSTLRDTEQDWARCPSKLYMYLPFERPIVTCRIGEAAELFGDAGQYYTAGDARSLAARLQAAAQLPADWRPAYDYHPHSWRARSQDFVAWLQSEGELASRRRPHRQAKAID